jgi:hypothetical protein
MLVKFNPTIGLTAGDYPKYCYNFFRCVDAVLTATAGSTPVVRPLTAANTYDNTKNMITSVIANTEAGGWTRSSSYNLVDASYADSGITGRTYIADYYNLSNKSDYPYKKISFYPSTYSTWTSYPNIYVRYGIHTATDYSGTAGYSNDTTAHVINPTSSDFYQASYNGSGYFINLASSNAANQGTALLQGQEYWIAATADYVIITEPLSGMLYCGTRTTQPWENAYSNNPPVVGWVTNLDNRYSYNNNYYGTNTKFAWMLTMDGTGAIRSTPSKVYNIYSGSGKSNTMDYVSGPVWINITHSTSNIGVNGCNLVGDDMGGPLFRSHYQSAVNQGAPGFYSPPASDSSGAFVPPAYPINCQISDSSSVAAYTYMNRGGRCLGIYKSMGGSDTYLNNYYTPGQIFTVDGDSFTPYVANGDTSYRDMFLLRAK